MCVFYVVSMVRERMPWYKDRIREMSKDSKRDSKLKKKNHNEKPNNNKIFDSQLYLEILESWLKLQHIHSASNL